MFPMAFYSTTVISKKYGLKANPLVFDFLHKNGYIYKSNTKPYQRLTNLGSAFGKRHTCPTGESWIVWEEAKMSPVLQGIKNEIINRNPFKLYHMTHIDNLSLILQSKQILPHNRISQYTDISNRTVNARRNKVEPCFGNQVHDYVPLYSNPRNAILYVVQNNHPEDIILLEIDNKICLQPQTIFSYKNAAADDAEFFYDIQALEIYIEQGLKKFISTYEEKGIQSAAFPILGGQNGGLNENNVIKIMYSYLDNLPIDIEIYQYDPRANDNIFQEFKNLLLTSNIDELAQATKIGKNYLKILIDEISKNNNLCQVSQLITIKGIGDVTLEKIFKYKKSVLHNKQDSLL